MAFVTWVRCVPIYQHDETHDDWEKQHDEPYYDREKQQWGKHEARHHNFRKRVNYYMDSGEHVKYDIIFDSNERSCWEYKKALYENYEKFDKDKIYKL